MRTDWEVLRLNGTMVAHKAMIKLVIKSRKYEICSISAPTLIKGKSPGYCSIRLEGYIYHDHLVEANDTGDTISTNAPKRDSRKDSTFFTSVPKGNTPKRNIPEGNFPKRNASEGNTILNNNDSNTIDLITKDINIHSINTDKTYWSDVTDALND